jgi:hypothetical protein
MKISKTITHVAIRQTDIEDREFWEIDNYEHTGYRRRRIYRF